MIQHYSDHAANERTFLAWVRTAVAIMAFGFVVERFDIFIHMARSTLLHTGLVRGSTLGETAGLGLMAFGLAIIAVAAVRFLRTTRQIDDDAQHQGPGSRFDLALALMLFLLGFALVTYMTLNVLGA
jgi:putative membrane protein